MAGTKIVRTNNEYLSYVNKNTKHIYMISEFIDNSIQSAKDCGLKNVKIDICLNYEQKKIFISDNAGGIPFADIAKAIKNGNAETDQKDSLNIFGVGMKMAAIWFGTRFTWFTNSIEDNKPYSTTFDVDELEQNNFETEDDENFDNIDMLNDVLKEWGSKKKIEKHGTIIVIENWHLVKHKTRYSVTNFKHNIKKENKNSVKSKVAKSLQEQLCSRYARYIRKNNFLEISISYINESGKEVMTDDNKPVIINNNIDLTDVPGMENIKKILNEDYFVKRNYEDENSDILNNQQAKNHYEKLKNDYYSKMNSFSVGNLKFKDIFEKFENNQPLYFNTKIKVEVENSNYEIVSEEVSFKFGYMQKGMNEFRGVWVFQDDRAVISGPNLNKDNTTWLSGYRPFSTEYYSVSDRFYGELDLNDKNVFKVDNNKIVFQGDIKDRVEDSILRIFNKDVIELFGRLIQITEYKSEIKKLQNYIDKDKEQFVDIINTLHRDNDFSIETEKWTQNNEPEEKVIKVSNLNNENKINYLVKLIDENNQVYKNIFGNNKTSVTFGNVFGFKFQPKESKNDEYVFIFYVNKSNAIFKNNLSEQQWMPLTRFLNSFILGILKYNKCDVSSIDEWMSHMEEETKDRKRK